MRSKKDFLKEYAQKEGLEIDIEETERLRNSLADTTITIRVPMALKEMIQDKAQAMNMPYQRLLKSILIDGLKKSA